MPIFAGRKLYLSSSALLLGAIVARILALHHAGRGVMASAKAVAMPTQRSRLREFATWHFRRSGHWELVGLVFVALAIGFWVASRRRCEPGLQGVPIVLLCFYVLLLFLIV